MTEYLDSTSMHAYFDTSVSRQFEIVDVGTCKQKEAQARIAAYPLNRPDNTVGIVVKSARCNRCGQSHFVYSKDKEFVENE